MEQPSAKRKLTPKVVGKSARRKLASSSPEPPSASSPDQPFRRDELDQFTTPIQQPAPTQYVGNQPRRDTTSGSKPCFPQSSHTQAPPRTPISLGEESAASAKQPMSLPPSWQEARDAEDNVYYYNTLTMKTQWDFPEPSTAPAPVEGMHVSTSEIEIYAERLKASILNKVEAPSPRTKKGSKPSSGDEATKEFRFKVQSPFLHMS